MHITENIGTKVHILLRLIFSLEFSNFWGITKEGGGPRPKMTKCDKGDGGGKNNDVLIDILFERPPTRIRLK